LSYDGFRPAALKKVVRGPEFDEPPNAPRELLVSPHMAVDFEALISLWSTPLQSTSAAIEAFGRFYSDPVRINGAEMSLAALAQRALSTQRAFSELSAVVLERSDTPTHSTVVFRMRGRHVGPLETPLGIVPATGKMVERQIIDLLKVERGLISEVWMVGDELSALMQLGAIARAF